MANSIRIKRRASGGAGAGAPGSLKNGELAYNENDNNLYYGSGDNGSGVATSILRIGGVQDELLEDIADISGTATGANQFIVSTAVGTFALESGPTVRTSIGLGTGDSPQFTGLTTTGNVSIGGTLNGHTIPGGAGTLALTTDALATTSGHTYITLDGQDIVQGDVVLGDHTSGNYVESLAEYSTNPGISLAGDTPAEGNNITISVDSTVIRDFGAQSIGGIKSFSALLNANAGIAVDTDKFTVADTTGNTSIAGTLAVTGVTTLTGALNANGGIAVDTDKFTVADTTGNTSIAGTLAVTGDTTLGTISAGTWTATDIAVAHGGTGASTAADAATNLGLGTGNSPGFTGLTLSGDLAVDGGDITSNASTFNFLTDNASVEVLNIGDSGGNLATTFPGTVDIDAGLNVGSSNQFAVSSTGAITGTGENITLLDADNLSAGTVNTARLPVATATAKGAIELFSDTVAGSAQTVSTTASRTYGIQLNSAGQAVVNVPWTDTTYTHHTQSSISVSEDLTGADVIDAIDITVNTEGHVTSATTTSRTLTPADLGLGTTDDVEFDDLTIGNITTSGYLRGPATFTIDPSAHGDDTGKVVIAGDLQVDGTTTTINSTVVEIDDLATKVAADITTSSPLTGAGLLMGTDPNSPPALSSGALVEFIYAHTNTRMELSSAMKITGGLEDTVIDGGIF